jgi:hypothetical protein
MYHRELTESRSSPVAQLNDASNGVILSPGFVERSLSPAVLRDAEVFSPPSQVSSDMGSDEGDYDSASILDSEVSNWTSDVADGEGATQHA